MKRRLVFCLMVLMLLALLVGPASAKKVDRPYRVYLPVVSGGCVADASGIVECVLPLPVQWRTPEPRCKNFDCSVR